MSDAQLLNAMKADDNLAFDEIHERYVPHLYSNSYKVIKQTEVAEEIAQDVLTDLWIKRDIRDIQNLEAYLTVAVRYQVFGYFRKTKRLPDFQEAQEDLAIYSMEADALLNERELKGTIAMWLAKQPEKRREIFRLNYMEEMTTRDISVLLNISQKTVQNQLLTAFNNLRAYLRSTSVLFIIAGATQYILHHISLL